MCVSTSVRLVLLFLVGSFEAECSGNILCYTCAWLKSGGGTKPDEDVCRAGKLDLNRVSVESCPKGCYTSIIYEYDPSKAESIGMEQFKNCTDDMRSLHLSNMTMFARKCSEKSFMNDHCLMKSVSGFHNVERFCRTNYCNGERSLSSTVLWTKWSSLLCLLLHAPIQLLRTINSEL